MYLFCYWKKISEYISKLFYNINSIKTLTFRYICINIWKYLLILDNQIRMAELEAEVLKDIMALKKPNFVWNEVRCFYIFTTKVHGDTFITS